MFLCLLALAQAQEVSARRIGGEVYASLTTTASLLGVSTSNTATSLTLRLPQGVLVVYHASPDVSFTESGTRSEDALLAISSPVIRNSDGWFAPKDVFELFGASLTSTELVLADGRNFPLSFVSLFPRSTAPLDTVDLGNGVKGVMMYAPNARGDESLSLMLVDLSLLALADPSQQNFIDSFMANLRDHRALFFSVTSSERRLWQSEIFFRQGEREFSARHPLSISVLQGDSSVVTSQQPALGVVLLPQGFNPRAPITIEWQGQRVSYQFKR